MKVSLVVVCHHSSEVMSECVSSFRRVGGEASVQTEVVAVEQSDDQGEQRAVAAMDVDRMVVRPNAGYAAGLNAGMEEATGETLLLANPDIRFAGGSGAVRRTPENDSVPVAVAVAERLGGVARGAVAGVERRRTGGGAKPPRAAVGGPTGGGRRLRAL